MHNEITSIIDRLCSPSKDKPCASIGFDTESDIAKVSANDNVNDATEAINVAENDRLTSVTGANDVPIDCIENMQAENIGPAEAPHFAADIEKYRQMIPYNTADPEKISQQESILELLISNGICDDETFKVFIAEPDLHKERASQILDGLYCVNTMMPNDYDNDTTIEWMGSTESMQFVAATDNFTHLVDDSISATTETNQIATTEALAETQDVASASSEVPAMSDTTIPDKTLSKHPNGVATCSILIFDFKIYLNF